MAISVLLTCTCINHLLYIKSPRDSIGLLFLFLTQTFTMIFLPKLLGASSLLLPFVSSTAAANPQRKINPPDCRFSLQYTQDDIVKNPENFASDLLYWEGKFHQNNVGYNTANGMSYDGTLLDPTTGLATQKHPFSAASKEVRGINHQENNSVLKN